MDSLYPDSDTALEQDSLLTMHGASLHWEQKLQRHAATSWKNCPGWNRNLPEFKMELPWAVFLPAVGDCPSALSSVCCSHAQHVLPLGHWSLEAKQGGRASFPAKDKCLPFQQKELCLTLGDNVLRHLWGFKLLIYKYLNKLVVPCLFTACFALHPLELFRTFGRSKWCQPG